jgi:hypothetical protein
VEQLGVEQQSFAYKCSIARYRVSAGFVVASITDLQLILLLRLGFFRGDSVSCFGRLESTPSGLPFNHLQATVQAKGIL